MTRLPAFWMMVISLAGPASIPAQTAITTDRPGFAFSSTTVPAGRLQAELGLPLLDYAGTPDDPAAMVVAALRYGLMDGFEARLSTVYFARSPGEAEQDGPTGIAGVRVGAKVGVVDRPGLAISVIPEIVVPAGDDALAGDRAAFSANASGGITAGGVGVTMVAGLQWDPVGDDSYDVTGLFVALLSRAISQTVSAYAEGAFLPGPGVDGAYAGLGAAWLLSPTVQLDASADFGLTNGASDAIVGVGISFLFH